MQVMVTIKHVAKEARVCIATVSNVLNRKKAIIPVAEETRKRVFEAVRELGYYPNANAAGLARRKTCTIGFIFCRPRPLYVDAFYSEVLSGIDGGCRALGYHLLYQSISDVSEAVRTVRELILGKKVDGLLVAGDLSGDLAAEIINAEYPVVVLGKPVEGGDRVHAVVPDHEGGFSQATEYLLEQGHRNIALFRPKEHSRVFEDAVCGYRKSLADASISFDPALICGLDIKIHENGEMEGIKESVARLLDERSDITALLCESGEIAVQAMDVIFDSGRSVPQDISVLSFNNERFCAHVRPTLSSVDPGKTEIGVEGVKKLLKLIEGEAVSPLVTTVKSQLIIRNSTGRVKSACVT
jgi:LacI family transcriptional regulator